MYYCQCQTSNRSGTLVGNKIVDHSDVVGASPVGADPTTSSFSTNIWFQCIGQRQLQDETRIVLGFGVTYIRDFIVVAVYHFLMQVSNLESQGFQQATNVQKEAIPHILNNTDVLIKSQTGSGETHQGPISLTLFPSRFKFDGTFVSLYPRFWYSDRYKLLYMARQLSCHGICKNLLQSDGQQRNYSKANFHRIWISDKKSLLKRASGWALLSHWGWDKMSAISQTIYSNAFSWMKICEFRLIFQWNLVWLVELTIFQHWFR